VIVSPDGALLVSDDSGNRIWKITAGNASLLR
jgi:glucose/arabinose dehydrogenase